ncbi:hypothetical protein [Siphonobacter sp. SORGH_AS_0500]|uniref:hypothetical protein n=1 Tax=Siphonobacter sp. SORGH_AS_0500 TaxID=1864824 RepID=UPI00285CF6AA|nr:hypothetical protein [Siphonobacter sp. SORGH_AS_0500]MDR6197972.1 hypothetical protein [Siphonobacter sp. SORGH_AS_0500]
MMNLDLKEIIEKIYKNQEQLSAAITYYRQKNGNDQDFVDFVSKIEPGMFYSTELVSLVADKLQLLNSSYLYNQFNLQDILKLYEIVYKQNDLNIDSFKDYILFKVNVLDSNEDINKEVKEYIEKLDKEKEELVKISESIS